jgi:hypothetical protein
MRWTSLETKYNINTNSEHLSQNQQTPHIKSYNKNNDSTIISERKTNTKEHLSLEQCYHFVVLSPCLTPLLAQFSSTQKKKIQLSANLNLSHFLNIKIKVLSTNHNHDVKEVQKVCRNALKSQAFVGIPINSTRQDNLVQTITMMLRKCERFVEMPSNHKHL